MCKLRRKLRTAKIYPIEVQILQKKKNDFFFLTI